MPEFKIQNTQVPREKLEESVVRAVASALELEPEEVNLDSSLQHNLGAESLDYLDIAFTIEREYKVHFPREDLLRRAGEHFGESNLVEGNIVSDLGLRMLRAAMPEIDPTVLKPGLLAHQVPGLFTVDTFVRVLDRLLYAKEEMSRECPECGGELRASDSLPEFECAKCGATLPYPSGDNVMFEELIRLSDTGEAAK